MINITEINLENVHQLIYSDGYTRADVLLKYAEKINSGNWMRYDSIMIKHYGADGENYLKLVLMFNNKNDITDINIGDILYIPDLMSLGEVLEFLEDATPGIVEFNDLTLSNDLTTVDPDLKFQHNLQV